MREFRDERIQGFKDAGMQGGNDAMTQGFKAGLYGNIPFRKLIQDLKNSSDTPHRLHEEFGSSLKT